MRINTTSDPVRRHRVAVQTIIMLTIAAVWGTAGPATAATGQHHSSQSFAVQAQQAGLTEQQATQLQASVDSQLRAVGGKQGSANRIELPGKGHILVLVPGETYARDLAAGEPIRTQAACPFEYFCMYRGTLYTGGQWNLWACGTYSLTDWVGVGSYTNNQTRGTWASMRDINFNVVTWSEAFDFNRYYNWEPIWYVVPC